jgi:hypothetical protein
VLPKLRLGLQLRHSGYRGGVPDCAACVDDGQKAPLQSISSIVFDMRTEKLQRRNQFRTITISTYAHEAEHDESAPDAIVAPAV